MKRKIYFGSNLKMYKTVAQTESYLKELADSTRELRAQNPVCESARAHYHQNIADYSGKSSVSSARYSE